MLKNRLTIGLIPVRHNSKSIPNKNIKELCGKPLVYWSAKALQECKMIDEFYIACDSDEIKNVVLSFNFSKLKIYSRRAENATDTASTESVLIEFLESLSINASDTIVLVQATNPFLETTHLTEALLDYNEHNKDSMLSCCRIKRFFWDEDGSPINYNYENRLRRQDFKGTLIENGAFYINKTENIIKHNNRLSGAIGIYEMPDYSATEIDEPDDWAIVEKLMYKYRTDTKTAFNKKYNTIKLLATDVDGVLTDAGMYYTETGDELKKFSTYDGVALQMCREKGIKTAFITGENTNIVKKRAEKLKVDFVYQGVKNKVEIAQKLCLELGFNLNEMAYIGDDTNDLALLQMVGIAACPNNAQKEVKNVPNIIQLKSNGGEGVLREFINLII